jgi:hypothetical protein
MPGQKTGLDIHNKLTGMTTQAPVAENKEEIKELPLRKKFDRSVTTHAG